MPRTAKPRWNEKRRRWFANIGPADDKGRATERFAPDTIGAKDEEAAWQWFRSEKERLREQGSKTQHSNAITVDWLFENYMAWAEGEVAEGRIDRANYDVVLCHSNILIGKFAGQAAASIAAEDLSSYGRALLKGFSPVYVRNILATANKVYNWAVRQKYLEANTVKGFEVPVIPRAAARYAERSEAAAFLGYWRAEVLGRNAWYGLDRQTMLLVRCLIHTGARPKEMCRLQWGDINWKGWKTSQGHVAAKAVLPPERWKAGKATGRSRTIFLTPSLTRAIRRLRDRGPMDATWVFVRDVRRGGAKGIKPWESGSLLGKRIAKVRAEVIAWQKEVEGDKSRLRPWERRRAAVTIRDKGADKLVNYRWRHTSISTMIMLGVDIATVAELTGTSVAMITKHYQHLLDKHLQAAAEKLAVRAPRG
ncbi:tyrosine-type recombinase/integrase [Singulisphaera sp. PoT]|uniref:tyrosine-type recombinase/integrase n=1 Tax=Singulisphaera sp. PoT TaxID=3411797 RepID=UPI003BF61072